MDDDVKQKDINAPSMFSQFGFAAEDLTNTSGVLEVFIPGLSPEAVGSQLSTETTAVTATTKKKDGNQGSDITVTTGPTWTARFLGSLILPLAVPPNVVKGEKLWVLKFDNANVMYYLPLGTDGQLRKVDRLVMYVGATPAGGEDSVRTTKNSYCLFVDPETKEIGFTTSRANGEKVAYTIKGDPEAGEFVLCDDIGNTILLNSSKNSISLTADTGSAMVSLTPGDVTIAAEKTINLKAPAVQTSLSEGARNSTAHQDMMQCIAHLVKCLNEVKAALGVPSSDPNLALTYCENAKMKYDQGL